MAFLHTLSERDRSLYRSLHLTPSDPLVLRTLFTLLTHVGGATMTLMLGVAPLFAGGEWFALGKHAILTLVLSHIAVQMVKRTVGRPRPSLREVGACIVGEPDRFSFPSGHAAAALSIALAYGAAYPTYIAPIFGVAVLIGISRVVVGVHYPGDVAAGQALAVITHVVLVQNNL